MAGRNLADLKRIRELLSEIRKDTDPKRIRKYERLAFEKAREMVLAGDDPETMVNPYER